MTRDEAIEQIAETQGGQALAAVIAKGYDDNTLSVIAAADKSKGVHRYNVFCGNGGYPYKSVFRKDH